MELFTFEQKLKPFKLSVRKVKYLVLYATLTTLTTITTTTITATTVFTTVCSVHPRTGDFHAARGASQGSGDQPAEE